MERIDLIEFIKENTDADIVKTWESHAKPTRINFINGEEIICKILANKSFENRNFESATKYINQAIKCYRRGYQSIDIAYFLNLRLNIFDIEGKKFKIYKTLLIYKGYGISIFELDKTINQIEVFYLKRILVLLNFSLPSVFAVLMVVHFGLLEILGIRLFKGLGGILFLAVFILITISSLFFKDFFNKVVVQSLRAVARII